MTHVMQSIRSNLVSTLTGLATTGANVYETRVYPLAEDKLPGLAIYTTSEASDYATMSPPRTVLRTITASVEIYVKAVSGYDDLVDNISAQIESALYTDRTRGGNARDTRVVSFESQFSGDPDQPVGSAVLQVEVDYQTLENSAEIAR